VAWRASGAYYPGSQDQEDAYGGPQAEVDFFISYTVSYTVADRAWAEWIAWYLEEARYTTVLQAWTFAWRNFVVRMRDAMQTAARTLAVSVWEIVPPVGSNAFTG
jgi:TIR domain